MAKTLIRSFIITLLVFTFGMIAVYLIPNEALEPQYTKSLNQIAKEDVYANFMFNSDASIMDNFMDDLMIRSCHANESYDSLLEAAFENNGYPRYWNGYILTLRPVLTFLSYQQIRYLNMLLLLVFFAFCFSGVHHEFGWVHALGFALSMIFCFLILIGESLQYFSVFIITFAALFFLLYIPCMKRREHWIPLLLVTGMAVNFFDMLTAPLVSFGIPLVIIISRDVKEERDFKACFSDMIYSVLAWGAGYGLCWVSKWIIGSIVLEKNIFEDAFTTAKFRVEGSDAYPLNRALMLKLNFETYFFAKGRRPFIFTAILVGGLAVFAVFSHRKGCLKAAALFLTAALSPYAWFMVFANHSQLHYFYTYRIQSVTLFAVFAFLGSVISFQKTAKARSFWQCEGSAADLKQSTHTPVGPHGAHNDIIMLREIKHVTR